MSSPVVTTIAARVRHPGRMSARDLHGIQGETTGCGDCARDCDDCPLAPDRESEERDAGT